ncbi:MAG: single-stranded-DNA-specific exonuclease RecJ [Bacteroides sp.]|nr:single-stranded-DNA-specific exonuclease RecJ [Bacillota bacterium]MCM1394062.1 single-stranded-DNA-specific exonuclease RecJ [[Eubacterium] siraeum]MCM1455581.1 single-stranded-DNA-specific exonuclease RecJ [Bacteroides sp.]
MGYVVRTQNFDLTDAQKQVAKSLGISETFMRLLLGRGFGADELEAYLNPSVGDMSSPYDFEGMTAAVARVREAIDKRQKILVYGDYDCDGICAVSILMLFLKDKADASYFIPDRNCDGYGVSLSALERLISSKRPDLVITVDCGITAVKEVEYLKSQGINVIITDHHEPQEQIPNCIVLDAKVQRRGFCEYCGAGVALKLIEALAGREEACKYFDIAAIATVADVVPLKGDNRIIAYYGIKQMQKSPRKGIKMLLGDDSVSSHNIMFRLAPRINAAGRLNSAMKVVDLFLQDDYFMLKSLAEELIRDNLRRQEFCDNVVREAKEALHGVDFASVGIIALFNENWEAGVLGIAAAKLVEEFKRPAVLFSKSGDTLKGSARSVPSINIFELFSELNGYFVSFGGHAQAAGVSIKEGDFEDFKKEANRLILASHSLAEFIPDTVCEMQLPLDFDFLSFAKELERLEPVGYGNPRPDFLIEGNGLKFEKIGFSKHVKCSTRNLDLLGFYDYADALYAKTDRVKFDVALDINCFRNILTAQGVLNSLEFVDIRLSEDEAICLNLHHLDFEGGAYVSSASVETAESDLDASPFGTVIVCFSKEDYLRVRVASDKIDKLPVFIGNAPELNPRNCVIVCPCAEFDFSYYSTVVFAGAPLCEGYIGYVAEKAPRCVSLFDCRCKQIEASDSELREIYKAIVTVASGRIKASNMHALYLQANERYKTTESKFLLAMKIFSQLGLVELGERGTLNISRKSVQLENSVAYRNILHSKNLLRN